MNKRVIRDRLRLLGALFFFWLYIPHCAIFAMWGQEKAYNQRLKSDRASVEYQIAGISTVALSAS